MVIDSGESYPNVRGVLIQGKADLITEEEDLKNTLHSLIPQFITKYFSSPEHAAAAKQFLAESQKKERALIRITTDRIQSWDYSKMM